MLLCETTVECARYSQCSISLLVVVTLYKVTTNNELVNTEAPLLGKYRVRFLRVSGHKIFNNQSVPNPVSD